MRASWLLQVSGEVQSGATPATIARSKVTEHAPVGQKRNLSQSNGDVQRAARQDYKRIRQIESSDEESGAGCDGVDEDDAIGADDPTLHDQRPDEPQRCRPVAAGRAGSGPVSGRPAAANLRTSKEPVDRAGAKRPMATNAGAKRKLQLPSDKLHRHRQKGAGSGRQSGALGAAIRSRKRPANNDNWECSDEDGQLILKDGVGDVAGDEAGAEDYFDSEDPAIEDMEVGQHLRVSDPNIARPKKRLRLACGTCPTFCIAREVGDLRVSNGHSKRFVLWSQSTGKPHVMGLNTSSGQCSRFAAFANSGRGAGLDRYSKQLARCFHSFCSQQGKGWHTRNAAALDILRAEEWSRQGPERPHYLGHQSQTAPLCCALAVQLAVRGVQIGQATIRQLLHTLFKVINGPTGCLLDNLWTAMPAGLTKQTQRRQRLVLCSIMAERIATEFTQQHGGFVLGIATWMVHASRSRALEKDAHTFFKRVKTEIGKALDKDELMPLFLSYARLDVPGLDYGGAEPILPESDFMMLTCSPSGTDHVASQAGGPLYAASVTHTGHQRDEDDSGWKSRRRPGVGVSNLALNRLMGRALEALHRDANERYSGSVEGRPVSVFEHQYVSDDQLVDGIVATLLYLLEQSPKWHRECIQKLSPGQRTFFEALTAHLVPSETRARGCLQANLLKDLHCALSDPKLLQGRPIARRFWAWAGIPDVEQGWMNREPREIGLLETASSTQAPKWSVPQNVKEAMVAVVGSFDKTRMGRNSLDFVADCFCQPSTPHGEPQACVAWAARGKCERCYHNKKPAEYCYKMFHRGNESHRVAYDGTDEHAHSSEGAPTATKGIKPQDDAAADQPDEQNQAEGVDTRLPLQTIVSPGETPRPARVVRPRVTPHPPCEPDTGALFAGRRAHNVAIADEDQQNGDPASARCGCLTRGHQTLGTPPWNPLRGLFRAGQTAPMRHGVVHQPDATLHTLLRAGDSLRRCDGAPLRSSARPESSPARMGHGGERHEV